MKKMFVEQPLALPGSANNPGKSQFYKERGGGLGGVWSEEV